MTTKATGKTGGAKSQRSETVTVRLDPKLRYMAEIAARVQRKTLSSFIEWAVAESFKKVEVQFLEKHPEVSVPADVLLAAIWDPIESDRLCILGSQYPNLLSHDEQKLWKLIVEVQHFAPLASDVGGEMKGFRIPIEQLERVRKHWELLKAAALDGELPSVVAKRIQEIDAKT